MNKPTEDELMRGLLAAFYLCGGCCSGTRSTPPDAVDEYADRIGVEFDIWVLPQRALRLGYLKEGWGALRVTDKGREFFLKGSSDADL